MTCTKHSVGTFERESSDLKRPDQKQAIDYLRKSQGILYKMNRIAIETLTVVIVFYWLLPVSSWTTTNKKNTMHKIRSFGRLEKIPNPQVSFDIFHLLMDDDGTFPNNPDHPLVLYKYAWKGRQEREARRMIENSQKWTSPWAWGVFPYHHYHSKAWELLVCVRGEANVQLGGEKGPTVLVETGDVVFVPPGFAHKQLDDRNGFTLLGSYPTESLNGTSIDTLTGAPTQEQRNNIAQCPVPEDPLCKTQVLF
eukprot:scaffold1754_cov105-Cylindrotheca_fusiformis.AAC.11